MKLLIFKTDIENIFKAKKVNAVLAYSTKIFDWSIDMEDIDNVLRIEADDRYTESDIIELVSKCGLHCESLPD
ncbi:hypothetical protein [Roseivirga misakiensis]|uniref:Uncharacterized protein n=1 Tax=Roseivirga misakiensis TaxID=1563681 RepID=A0A1E5SXY6_9BACT|nr:hypothetical protein [Roseivirga misakiensis]OEK03975.1 hypothetical protein BFP71_10780 [Roseivirga misakiensis]